MRKKTLGRGLEAILSINKKPEIENTTKITQKNINFHKKEELNSYKKYIEYIEINRVQTSTLQPRKIFDENQINELADSIKEKGVIQPIIVRKILDKYQIIAGERRYRASKLANLKTIPAIVINADDKESLQLAIIENIHRSDLNVYEEAFAYKYLLKEYNLTHDDLANQLGKNRVSITNTLRILNLPEEVIDLVKKNVITKGHCKVLAGIENKHLVIKLANKIKEKKLSVRELEKLIKKYNGSKLKPKLNTVKSADIINLENKFTEKTGLKVKIDSKNNKGKISIFFSSLDDFELIKEKLL